MQSVLRLVRSGDETVICCDNQCPPEVSALGDEVNRLLLAAGRANVEWVPVPDGSHDDHLWDAVRRLPSDR